MKCLILKGHGFSRAMDLDAMKAASAMRDCEQTVLL